MCVELSQQEEVASPGTLGAWGAGAQAYKQEAMLPGEHGMPAQEQVVKKCFYIIGAVCSWAIPFTFLGFLGEKELCSLLVLLWHCSRLGGRTPRQMRGWLSWGPHSHSCEIEGKT